MSNKFKVGDRVRRVYGNYGDMSAGDEDIVVECSGSCLELEKFGGGHAQSSFELVWSNQELPISEELKDNNMDIEDVKNLDKDILKKAKANVLKARKEMQTEQAEAFLTKLFEIKDAVEDKIGADQEVLDRINEIIKVFDVK